MFNRVIRALADSTSTAQPRPVTLAWSAFSDESLPLKLCASSNQLSLSHSFLCSDGTTDEHLLLFVAGPATVKLCDPSAVCQVSRERCQFGSTLLRATGYLVSAHFDRAPV